MKLGDKVSGKFGTHAGYVAFTGTLDYFAGAWVGVTFDHPITYCDGDIRKSASFHGLREGSIVLASEGPELDWSDVASCQGHNSLTRSGRAKCGLDPVSDCE